MKSIYPLLIALVVVFHPFKHAYADGHGQKEMPVKHIEVAEILTLEEAKAVFFQDTNKLKAKKTLDNAELQEIHIITYTLEQSVAFFIENLNDDAQILANEIAVVVEDIHLDSENNRASKTRSHLANYLKMADRLSTYLD